MNNDVLLTRQGYDKIEQELEMLITVRRKEVAARIKEAISFGDLSENSEYDSAKIEQAELEERILKLEGMLRKAIIIEEDAISLDKVNIGVKVKIKDLEYDEVEDYSIVGSTEADPYENKISNESPVGTALIGKKVGDVVKIQVPDGTIRYEVLEIYK